MIAPVGRAEHDVVDVERDGGVLGGFEVAVAQDRAR